MLRFLLSEPDQALLFLAKLRLLNAQLRRVPRSSGEAIQDPKGCPRVVISMCSDHPGGPYGVVPHGFFPVSSLQGDGVGSLYHGVSGTHVAAAKSRESREASKMSIPRVIPALPCVTLCMTKAEQDWDRKTRAWYFCGSLPGREASTSPPTTMMSLWDGCQMTSEDRSSLSTG